MGDRTVHATTADGGQVVRYDRAGQWWLEYHIERLRPARRLKLAEAVELATTLGSYVYLGLRGGRQFDAAVKRAAGQGEAP